jgi:hypothetical protein
MTNRTLRVLLAVVAVLAIIWLAILISQNMNADVKDARRLHHTAAAWTAGTG